MNEKPRRWAISLLTVALAATTACSRTDGGTAGQTPSSRPGNPNAAGYGGPHRLSEPDGVSLLNAPEGRIPVTTIDGKPYIASTDLIHLLEYQSEWNEGTNKLIMGAIDSEYEFTAGDKRAVKEEEALTLAEAPRVTNGMLQLPVSSLAELFQDEITYEVRGNEVVLKANPESIDRKLIHDPPDTDGVNDELSFADDPNDPYKGEEAPVWAASDEYADAVPALRNIDMSKVIGTARRYMGIKYKFGASPYPQSGKFDCSSFTRYVFDKYGVGLPRLARTQARQGTAVSRKQLRKGDLLFFYVPGRFKSNNTVGHVGIYMGNNKMIHSSPAPDNGVQISNINQKYWKKTFLRARRVAY